MLIEAYAMRMSTDSAHEIATHICEVARDGVNIRPEELEPKKEEAVKAENPAPAGAIPEGTVLGDGHIKYVLARVDTRLLHGQVATTWTKSTQPTRIIVALKSSGPSLGCKVTAFTSFCSPKIIEPDCKIPLANSP